MFSYKQALNKSAQVDKISEAKLQKLKQCLIKCYLEINEVCKKHDIKLIALGGTLLGLVRHNGFIPWDDDLDLGLMRKDYERFIKIFHKELGDRYVMSAPKEPYKAFNRFVQVYRKNTYLKNGILEKSSSPNMVYIDIFPIDYVPDAMPLRLLKGAYCNFFMAVAGCVSMNENKGESLEKIMRSSFKGRILYDFRNLVGSVFSFRSSQTWFYYVDNLVRSKKRTKSLAITVGRKHYFGEIVERSAFFPLKKGLFENVEMYMPCNPDRCLKRLYGEGYMQLPPENERESHYITEVKAPPELL